MLSKLSPPLWLIWSSVHFALRRSRFKPLSQQAEVVSTGIDRDSSNAKSSSTNVKDSCSTTQKMWHAKESSLQCIPGVGKIL